MSTPAWISLGSNLGDRREILDHAIKALSQTSGVFIHSVSSYHETQPVGGPPGQGPFLNAAAHLETILRPHQLLETLQGIENEAGRVRTVRWGERTLDLDILFFGTEFLDLRRLKVPHPRLALRRFVLEPLAEIAPTLAHPQTRRTIAELLADLDRKPRLVAIEGLEGSRKSAVFERLVAELPGFGIAEADLGLPEIGEGETPHQIITEGLERKAEALNARRWAIETLRVPWLVADYFLDFDILHATGRSLWRNLPETEDEVKTRILEHREWKGRLNGLLEVAMSPTFAVILPGDREVPRRSALTRTPRLWPESDDPDAIVAEILATCRGIDGL